MGGMRKVIKTGDNAQSQGTIIQGFENQLITIAQLKAALGLTPQILTPPAGGGSSGSLVPGPGLSGGGPLIGAVPLYLTAPVHDLMGGDGGSDGDPGPPGLRGTDGVIGKDGQIVFLQGPDGEDGWGAVPGGPGPQGNTGASGTNGPVVFVMGEDGSEGDFGPPGVPGAAAVGAMLFVGTSAVAGAAATTLPLTGLNLDTDQEYYVRIKITNATASNSNISLFFNADTTAANYDSDIFTGNGVTLSGARANNAIVTVMSASLSNTISLRIVRSADGFVVTTMDMARNPSSGITYQCTAHSWRTLATNVTGLTISSSVASALAIGCSIKVWKITG